MSRWAPAYIALGSNLGGPLTDPQRQIETAFDRLAQLKDTRLVARSPLYRTRPMGPQDQPDFINAVAGVLTQLDPRALLAETQRIEIEMGRTPPTVRWGPRVIDLDLLLHGSAKLESPQLTLPHPGIYERNFVLYPLADIAPTLRIPGRGQPTALVQCWARQLGSDGIECLRPRRTNTSP